MTKPHNWLNEEERHAWKRLSRIKNRIANYGDGRDLTS
jgi:hypothetical protein